jgi:hypothetical protein
MTNQYFLARIAGRDPNLRAADADRERVAERLRKSHAEGRLDLTEFQERLERCYAARTYGDLDQLVRDLPREPEPEERRSTVLWRWRLARLLPIVLVLAIVGAAAGHHAFWLWIVVVFVLWRMTWWRRRRWYAGGRRGPGDWI